MTSTATLRLQPAPEAAGEARHAVADLCRQNGLAALADTAALLASELVTNAVVHGSGIVTVVARCEHGSVGVAVRDDTSTGCQLHSPGELDEQGRGLVILQALSTAWGVRNLPDGKCVWFRLG
jgi:anti-sigma regulatory factor (Ser/Thr protein kinase)